MAAREGVCPAGRSHHQDSSDSDSEPEPEPARFAPSGMSTGSFPCSQVIHSGHFMVSSPHSDSGPRRRKSGGSLKYDFDTVNRTWCQTYRFGPFSSGSLSIDPTLTRLFDCMSLAYRYGWALHQWQPQPGSTTSVALTFPGRSPSDVRSPPKQTIPLFSAMKDSFT